MKNAAIQKIFNQFLKFKEYVNPPNEETIGWVLHYTNKYDYDSILKKYGIRYLLILLDMYEDNSDYEICDKIVTFIQEHNKEFLANYPTHITKLKKA